MDKTEFRRLKDGLIINVPPASGAVIDAAESKLRHRLMSSAMFAKVEVETTEDPDQLLVAMVRYRPGTPRRQVCSYLEAVWISELRLPGLDAFHFDAEDGHVELESVTGDTASGYFLSLHLIALEGSAEDFSAAPPARPRREADVPPARKRWFSR